MAKKRKTSRSRKAARPKAGAVKATAVKVSARRPPARPRKGGETDPMNVVAVVLVLVLVGLGIYLYQANHQESAATGGTPPVAMEKK
jgi:hypothetical protein